MKTRAVRIGIVLGAAAILYFVTPPDLPVCGFRWLTGRPCPLCGLTHALFALAKGHMREAIRFHALSPLAVLIVGAVVWDRPLGTRFWLSCGALFAGYGIWRMFW